MGPLWIVIPTRDRPEALGRQIARVLEETGKVRGRRVEVVVCDDGSEPPARVPHDGRVTLLRSPAPRGPNVTRDLGVRRSPRDAVIVEIDDHNLMEPGALAEIDRTFRAGACVAFGDFRRENLREGPSTAEPMARKGGYRPWRFRDDGACHTGMLAYRRELYDEAGGYRADDSPEGNCALMLRMEERLRGRRIVAIPRPACRAVTSARAIPVRTAREQAAGAAEHRRRVVAEVEPDTPDPEPEPPDFSDVKTSYTWRGHVGGEAVLNRRTAHLYPYEEPPVSAVVPLYRSERFVERCLRSLRDNLPPGSEIIAVDDGSPDRSADVARRVLEGDVHALLVRLSRNTGYAHATNAGAGVARGRHILLFNADAFAQHRGFLEPMLRLLDKKSDVAVVGNRHVTPGGRVDSEGSEFSWRARTYQHVGRDLKDPIEGSGAKERDMVTFACALVRGSCWRELGGLDERYRRAYFEDSDFCMRARLHGWRILYVPDREAEILHVGRHSGAGNGSCYQANRRLFERRWMKTGLVDRFRKERGLTVHKGRVVVCMIACSEEEFVASAIESVYPLADRIVIVEGGNRFAVEAGLCDPEGRSIDRTVEEIEAVPDPDGKIELHRAPGRPWRDKCEMRENYAGGLRPGDWMLLLDADEVFTERGLWRMSALMHEADVICPAFHLFWNDLSTLGTGRWDDFRQIKAVRWRGGLTYLRNHNVPTDPRGVAVTAIGGVRVARPDERLYCHYSWAGKTDEKLRVKCAYYVAQNGAKVFPPDYFDRVFLPWRVRPREIEQRFGTHPYGGGATEPFTGSHPQPVTRRMRDGRIRDSAATSHTPEIGG